MKKKAGRKPVLTDERLSATIQELDSNHPGEHTAIYNRRSKDYGVTKQSLIVRVCNYRKKVATPPTTSELLEARIEALEARLREVEEQQQSAVKIVPVAGVVLPKAKVLDSLDTEEWKDYQTLSQEIFGGTGEENRIRKVVHNDKGRSIESRTETQFRSGRNCPVTVLRRK